MSDPEPKGQIELRTEQRLLELDRAAWQRLEGTEHPFLAWDFLSGLETTGCVSPERGWYPMHLTAWLDGTLVAAAPAYIKGDGMGDFSRDWGYQGALQQLGGHAYPKLVVGIPFSPVTGPRILVAPNFDHSLAARLLMNLAREAARSMELGSIQVLYHSEAEVESLANAGMATRTLMQYHWRNYDYSGPESWLDRLPGRKRKQIRKERRAPASQDIAIETWRHADRVERNASGEGPELDFPDIAFELYRTTCEKYMWGGTYLNRDFFEILFTDPALSQSVELVTAQRPGAGAPAEIVAGAINIASPTHLYGRYWGCHEEHRFLHFNVCLYHSIDECIARGLEVFEGGAGGEHKISRGFEPTLVYHSLWFAQDHIQNALTQALARDADEHRAGIERWKAQNGLDRDRS